MRGGGAWRWLAAWGGEKDQEAAGTRNLLDRGERVGFGLNFTGALLEFYLSLGIRARPRIAFFVGRREYVVVFVLA